MSVGAANIERVHSPAVLSFDEEIISILAVHLIDMEGSDLDDVVKKLNVLHGQLKLSQMNKAINYIMIQGIMTSNPTLVTALLRSNFQIFNFRERLSECYTPSSFDKFAIFLEACIQSKNNLLVRECALSLVKHSKEAGPNQTYKTIANFYKKHFENVAGISSILIMELLNPSVDLPKDDLDDRILLYLLAAGIYKDETFAQLIRDVNAQLSNLTDEKKADASLRLMKSVCYINEGIFFSNFLIPVLNETKVSEDRKFRIGVVQVVVEYLKGSPSQIFLTNYFGLIKLFKKLDFDTCMKEYLDLLSPQDCPKINQLLKISLMLDFPYCLMMCFDTIEKRGIHNLVDSNINFSKFYLTPIPAKDYRDLPDPNMLIKAQGSPETFSCHGTIIRIRAPKLAEHIMPTKKESDNKVIELQIPSEQLSDMLKIIYGQFWEDKKYNPSWSLQTMAAVYKLAVQWELSDAKRACMAFLISKKYTPKDFDVIYAAFAPMPKEDFQRLLDAYHVFLTP